MVEPPPSAQLDRVEAPEGFRVMMPGEPQAMRNTIKIPAGDVAVAIYTSQVDGNIYSISIADYPEKVVAARPPQAFLDEGRAGVQSQLKGELSHQQPLTLGGYPGHEFTVTSEQGTASVRNYLVGPRFYTLLVFYNPAKGAPYATGFLTSLELVNPPPPVERAKPSPEIGP